MAAGLVTGPLGGANFLSVQDYNSIDPLSPAKNTIGLFNSGTQLARNQQARESEGIDLAEKKQLAEERNVIAQAEMAAAQNYAQKVMAPQQQGTIAPQQAPAPVQQPVAQTPIVQQPAPQAETQQSVPTNNMMPSGAPEQTAQPTAPVQPATPPVQAAPQPPAQAPVQPPVVTPQQVVETLRTQPVVAGKMNKLNDDVLSTRQKVIEGLLSEGKIRPQTAQAYMAEITTARDKQIAAAAALQEKITKIQKEEGDAKEKRLKIAKEVRDQQDNFSNDVYQTLKAGDLGSAQQLAKEYGLEVDFENPQALRQLEMRAKRSPEYKAAQEEARKAAKEDREIAKEGREAGAIQTKDLPDGFFRKSTNDPQVYKMDREGKLIPVSSDEVFAASKMKAAAGAARTSTGGSPGSSANANAAPGDISAILIDKQGNRKLDPAVVKNLSASQKQMNAATTLLSQIPEIETTVLPNASTSGVGEAVGKVGKFFGTTGGINEANSRMSQFANSALGVIDSPLMKGAPSEADARRALSVINDPQAPLNVKQEAVRNLKGMLQEAVESHNSAISQYNDETKQRLKGAGIDVATVKPAAGAERNLAPQAAVDALKANPKLADQFKAKYGYLPKGF